MFMFDVWKLNWQIRKVSRHYDKELKRLAKQKAPAEQVAELENEAHFEVRELELELDAIAGHRLFREARRLDVEIPPFVDRDMWVENSDGRIWFTSKGRAHVRKIVDAENARRFEVKTLWVTKFILPILAALVGIIGALTGFVAVLKHKPQAPLLYSDCTRHSLTGAVSSLFP